MNPSSMDAQRRDDKDLYKFYAANIHERRPAAYVARAAPVLIVFATLVVVLVAVTINKTLLLVVCALLNVSLWIWLVTTGFFGIVGSINVSQLCHSEKATVAAACGPTGWPAARKPKSRSTHEAESSVPAKTESSSEPASNDPGSQLACDGNERQPQQGQQQDAEQQDRIRHVIVIPNYDEPVELMAETLQSIAEAAGAHPQDFWVVLGMEAREKAGMEKVGDLESQFQGAFGRLMATYHPAHLEEKHQDGSKNMEVPGKASNLKWAVQEAYNAVKTDTLVGLHNTLLTVADADCLFHHRYFDHVAEDFRAMRKDPGDQQRWTMWQAPQLPFRNYYESPAPSRVWGYVSSMYEFGGVCSLSAGGHHMVFSAYSVHLELAAEGQLWDGDVIAEDHHAYLKAFFYSAYESLKEVKEQERQHKYSEGCRPMLRVRPVMYPVKSTSVVVPGGTWKAYRDTWWARWDQAVRHSQAVAELSYCLLATWDLICTLPLRAWNLLFFLRLSQVLCRLCFIHVIPLMQSIALGILSLYWLINQRKIPMCPDKIWLASSDGETLLCGLAGAWVLVWPVVVPICFLAMANLSFLASTFLGPKESAKGDAAKRKWLESDGNVNPIILGSKRITTLALVCWDCMVLLLPTMVIYGMLAQVKALWTVLWCGNQIKYVTASKGTSSSPILSSGSTSSYNTMSSSADKRQ